MTVRWIVLVERMVVMHKQFSILEFYKLYRWRNEKNTEKCSVSRFYERSSCSIPHYVGYYGYKQRNGSRVQ